MEQNKSHHDHDHHHHSESDHDHHHHHHHHHSDADHHHHHDTKEGASTLTETDKLMIRLEHAVKHNMDHGDTYASMAGTAENEGITEAAKIIRNAVMQYENINKELLKALEVIKSAASGEKS